jgi:hypothetical protein
MLTQQLCDTQRQVDSLSAQLVETERRYQEAERRADHAEMCSLSLLLTWALNQSLLLSKTLLNLRLSLVIQPINKTLLFQMVRQLPGLGIILMINTSLVSSTVQVLVIISHKIKFLPPHPITLCVLTIFLLAMLLFLITPSLCHTSPPIVPMMIRMLKLNAASPCRYFHPDHMFLLLLL